jgi:hypothetical protein
MRAVHGTEGYVVVGADYDQIELRFICVAAQDTTMQEVFLSGDVATTAALVLNKPLDEVSKEERSNYGRCRTSSSATAHGLPPRSQDGHHTGGGRVGIKVYFARFSHHPVEGGSSLRLSLCHVEGPASSFLRTSPR